MAYRFNYDKAARILADSTMMRDSDAAKKHGVCEETIRRYRIRFEKDARLREMVAEKKQIQDVRWADRITNAIASAVDFLDRAAKAADPQDPEAIHAIAGALKMLGEVQMAREMLDERIAQLRRGPDAGARPNAAHAGSAGVAVVRQLPAPARTS
jgi:transposase-like protein